MERRELGRLLVRARSRVAPGDVGLPEGSRRRVAGLRREEVAVLAGVSVDYVTRIEQGRGAHPSPSVLASLARALRMSDDERREMFDLADAASPREGHVPMLVRASILRLIERLEDQPAVVLSAKADVLAWNPLAAALLGDFSGVPEPQRNIVRQRFLGEPSRVSVPAAEAARTDARSVTSLRAAAAKYPDDPELRRLVAELRAGSDEFVRLWDEAPSQVWRSHRKTITHPSVGAVTLDCDALEISESDQTVIVYSAAPGSRDAELLQLVKVVGTQRLDADAR
ncbi:helix-turn-helix transcriptional regulator [Mumia zhuanghuii]|uniref:Helix-turn-helix domain-containing protein n=1 Tax=Mumia zhuanghuii TaxID=2585211 RepID=A0A5C4MGK5_9ACTN|nr:helix-turn-helix transcriptional regulator [Mumia zhuanghuii]TNC33664.1 helix-turn-helix domain-containing protein [Mumia zhuanghuii]TNC37072.1 helix-turn-helix domain-containing protein [Mumia zhuanghuii]